MKILVISRSFPPIMGGISFSLKAFYDNFIKRNHKLTLSVFPYDFKKKYSFKNKLIDVYSLRKFIPRNSLSILRGFVSFLKDITSMKCSIKSKYKILSYFLNRLVLFINLLNFYKILKFNVKNHDYDFILSYDSGIPAYLGYYLKRNYNKKLIIVSHGNDILHNKLYQLQKKSLKSADGIIVRTNFIKNLVSRRFQVGESKIFICPDGIREEDFTMLSNKSVLREELSLNQDDFIILTVGVLNSIRKGFDLVLKSLKDLRDEHNIDISKFKYIIIGHENQKIRNWLIKIAKSYGLIDNFIILTDLSDQLRNKYYEASDIYVMPSRDMRSKGSIEGFGNVFIEAGFYKLPSIGSNTGGIPDVIIDGETGFIINNITELTEKIRLLYENQSLRLKMGDFAHRNASKSYMWKKIYEDYLNVFNQLKD